MPTIVNRWSLMLALVLEMLVSSQAPAAWPERKPACPRSSYSPLNYWAPSLFRCQAHLQRPGPYLYAPDPYPYIPVQAEPIIFPCPPVSPSARPYPGLPYTPD